MANLTQEKAGKILKHGEVRGRKLTPAQRRLFGWVRGGMKRPKSRLGKKMKARQHG